MKFALPLCALALLLAPLAASAQRKGMGPSAIEAARLKKYPPPNYLSHYLPDDRYKIKGKVWKFVSTDLDTYYHLPWSSNMLRQPASRVIGFASAKDAEEAGYVADPTDGTSRVAAASMPAMDGMGMGATAQDQAYVQAIIGIIKTSSAERNAFIARYAKVAAPGLAVSPGEKTEANRYLALIKGTTAQVRRLKPPAKYVRFHALVVQAFVQSQKSIQGLVQAVNTGDPTRLNTTNIAQFLQLQNDIVREAVKVGIDPRQFR